MSALNRYLTENCTEEQSSLLINCFDTLIKIGLVDIEFNTDEILSKIDEDDLFTTIQKCYHRIRQFQLLAFDQLEIKVNNFDDIHAPNDLLLYLDQLEDSDNDKLICQIIENSATPEDALFALLEQVVFADISSIMSIVEVVSSSLIERLYYVHQSHADLTLIDETQIKTFDERKLNVLKELWLVKDINPLRSDILNDQLNLPVNNEYWKSRTLERIKSLRQGDNKSIVALRLLEGCLVTDVEWKQIKKTMRKLANEIFNNDTLFVAELSYFIDNVCMRFNINESI